MTGMASQGALSYNEIKALDVHEFFLLVASQEQKKKKKNGEHRR